MKQKLMIIAAIVVCMLTLNGCLLYSLSKSCVVSVKVYDVYGEDARGDSVYMFHAKSDTPFALSKKSAVRALTTDGGGYAEFRVKEIEMMFEDEYPFVFATFKGEEENGRAYILARRNQRHSIVIRQTW